MTAPGLAMLASFVVLFAVVPAVFLALFKKDTRP